MKSSHYEQTTLNFLKLGGSLITDKLQPSSPKLDVINRLANEISKSLKNAPGMNLVLGHGSGSFGHVPASQYGTRGGVHTPDEWLGFIKVWRQANSLNRLVMDALAQCEIPAIPFPASACILAKDSRIVTWNLETISAALKAGLVPVIFGDVVFDEERGGTILSTEDLFEHLVPHLNPARVLIAGLEPGVWADYPKCTRLFEKISPADYHNVSKSLSSSSATDVTGGMVSKVEQCLRMLNATPGLIISIFGGETPGAVERCLSGELPGTQIISA